MQLALLLLLPAQTCCFTCSHQRKLLKVRWTAPASIKPSCSGMQQQRNLHMGTTTRHVYKCSCASYKLLHPAPTLPPKMLLTLCNLRWWCFFLPPTSKNTTPAVMVVITCCNLHWWCFSLEFLYCCRNCITDLYCDFMW